MPALALSLADAGPAGVVGPSGFDIPGLPLWSAAVRRAQAGQGRAKLVCLGDSTTAGFSVGKAAAWPRRLADLMAPRGGRETCFFSDARLGATYDSRMVRGAGWAADTTRGLGGGFYRNATVTANPLVFTPQTAFDTVDLFLYGTTSVEVTIGAGTPVTRTGAFGLTVGKRTVTCAEAGLGRGAHTVSIRALNDGGNTGLDCHDAARGISVLNAGVSSWRAVDFNLANYGVSDTLDVLDPDLTIINIGINDWNQASEPTEAAFKAEMQTIITKAVTAGSEVLMVVPVATSGSFASKRAVFAQYIVDLATSNGLVAPLDLGAVLGTYATASAAGDMVDTLHPSAQGHGKIAAALKARIA